MTEPDRDMTKCQRCDAAVEPALHACPFQEDVYNDPTPCCNCCAACAQECCDET